MRKEIINNIFIGQAGDDRIVLEQLSSGNFKVKEFNHSCKDLDIGLDYMISLEPKVKEMLRVYNSAMVSDDVEPSEINLKKKDEKKKV